MAREELATMTDQELLAYQREHHDDPDMTLEKATETQRLALHCWASGAATRRRTGLPSRRRDVALRQTLFPCDSAVLESKGWTRLEKRHDDGWFT